MGRQFGRFEVFAELGRGSSASVHLARTTSGADADKIVAVKVLAGDLRHDETFLDIFLEESAFAATLRHPNLVPILDLGTDESSAFLILEYVQGDSLANLIGTATRLARFIPYSITLRIVLDALAGLSAAHEARAHSGAPRALLHRDLSPRSVLVGIDGVTRVSDFGMARALGAASNSRVQQLAARLSYVAPEQLAGRPVDQRADTYSLGVTLWNALTLQPLYTVGIDPTRQRWVTHGEYRPASRIHTAVPTSIDAIIERAAALDRAQRFESASEFARALESARGVSIATAREVSSFIAGASAQKIQAERDAVLAARGGTPRAGRLTGASKAVPMPAPLGQTPVNLAPVAAAEPKPRRRRSLDDDEPEALQRVVAPAGPPEPNPSEVDLELEVSTTHDNVNAASVKIAEAIASSRSMPASPLEPPYGGPHAVRPMASAVATLPNRPVSTASKGSPPAVQAEDSTTVESLFKSSFKTPPEVNRRALVAAVVVALVALVPIVWMLTHR